MKPNKRGGRRPGAGAPRGNFNAVRHGKNSKRMLQVYEAFLAYEDKAWLVHQLYHAGFLTPRSLRFNGDVHGITTWLYKLWFGPEDERPQLNQCNQTHRRIANRKRPPPDSNSPEPPAANP